MNDENHPTLTRSSDIERERYLRRQIRINKRTKRRLKRRHNNHINQRENLQNGRIRNSTIETNILINFNNRSNNIITSGELINRNNNIENSINGTNLNNENSNPQFNGYLSEPINTNNDIQRVNNENYLNNRSSHQSPRLLFLEQININNNMENSLFPNIINRDHRYDSHVGFNGFGLYNMPHIFSFDSTEFEDIRLSSEGQGHDNVSNSARRQLERVEYKSDERNICAICREDFLKNQMIYKLSCSHYFHISCLDEELRHRARCPICRRPIE